MNRPLTVLQGATVVLVLLLALCNLVGWTLAAQANRQTTRACRYALAWQSPTMRQDVLDSLPFCRGVR